MNLQDALNQIDKVFGKGYAKAHPELLGQYLVANAIHEGLGEIDKTFVEVAEAALKLMGLR